MIAYDKSHPWDREGINSLCIETQQFLVNQRYIWKSNGHHLSPSSSSTASLRDPVFQFKKSDVCRIFNGRNVLIIGDSINNEFFLSFLNTMTINGRLRPARTKYYHCYNETNSFATSACFDSLCLFSGLCSGGFTIDCQHHGYPNFNTFFVRNYPLGVRKTDESIPKRKHYVKPWVNLLVALNISVLLLNKGAHFVSHDKYIRDLGVTLTHLAKHHFNLTVIFRDTPSGHPNCKKFFNSVPNTHFVPREGNDSNHGRVLKDVNIFDLQLGVNPIENHNDTDFTSSSINQPTIALKSIKANHPITKFNPNPYVLRYSAQHKVWGWNQFHIQNKLAQRFIAKYFPWVTFMEVSLSTNLRPDSHCVPSDCLHYCIPGSFAPQEQSIVDPSLIENNLNSFSQLLISVE
jgi:hypothetical protein